MSSGWSRRVVVLVDEAEWGLPQADEIRAGGEWWVAVAVRTAAMSRARPRLNRVSGVVGGSRCRGRGRP